MGGAPSPTQYTTNTQVDAYCTSGNAVTIFGGSGAITVPAWINGDFCASGGSNPAIGNPNSGSPIAVHIGGTMYDQQGPTCVIGDGPGICGNQGPVASVKIIGGCWNHHVAAKVPCDQNSQTAVNGGSGVYAASFTPTDPIPTPSKPLFDAATELNNYNTASPGPKNACGAGSSGSPPANLFDSNTTLDGSLGTTDFATHMGAGTWVCKTSSGELDWSWSGINGSVATLGLQGMVFFDGSFTLERRRPDQVCPEQPRKHLHRRHDDDDPQRVDVLGDQRRQLQLRARRGIRTTSPSDPLIFFAAYNRAGRELRLDDGRIVGLPGHPLHERRLLARQRDSDDGIGVRRLRLGDRERPVPGHEHASVRRLGVTTTTGTPSFAVAPRTWRQCPITGCS